MTEEQKRLEKALLEFIEGAVNEPEPEKIKLVPALAHELNVLWSLNR